jgi:hypothetical protein
MAKETEHRQTQRSKFNSQYCRKVEEGMSTPITYSDFLGKFKFWVFNLMVFTCVFVRALILIWTWPDTITTNMTFLINVIHWQSSLLISPLWIWISLTRSQESDPWQFCFCLFVCLFVCFKTVSCYVTQAGLKLAILLLRPPKCLDYRLCYYACWDLWQKQGTPGQRMMWPTIRNSTPQRS